MLKIVLDKLEEYCCNTRSKRISFVSVSLEYEKFVVGFNLSLLEDA